MNASRHFVLTVTAAIAIFAAACFAQEASQSGQAAPALSGSGIPGDIAVWKNSTTLANSVMFQNGGKIGIGTATPVSRLEVNGNARVDGDFTLSGSILSSGGNQLLWMPNDGSYNFSAGLGALPQSTTGMQNTAVGVGALGANTSGPENTAIGANALNRNNDGGGNTALGFQALVSNISGNYNTAVGGGALGGNTNGVGNTAAGALVLFSNTTGVQNAALGFSALYNNTFGYANTAVGYYGLFNNASGLNNTAIGFAALQQNTSGNNNIAVGSQSGSYVTGSGNIDIGHQGLATDNGTIRIGTVGVQTSAFVAGIYGATTGLPGVPVMVDPNGNLGTISSSRRYKEDIRDMGDASSGLMRLRPVSFRYKTPFGDGTKPVQYGLISEEVAQVYPELVTWTAEGQVEAALQGTAISVAAR